MTPKHRKYFSKEIDAEIDAAQIELNMKSCEKIECNENALNSEINAMYVYLSCDPLAYGP